jgi:hypothetical protein
MMAWTQAAAVGMEKKEFRAKERESIGLRS